MIKNNISIICAYLILNIYKLLVKKKKTKSKLVFIKMHIITYINLLIT